MDKLKNTNACGMKQPINASYAKQKISAVRSQNKENIFADQEIKILIVEDNPLIRLSLETMLSSLGYVADFAEDGKAALSAYSSEYQLILMDIEIPYLSGIEVTQIIRAIEKNHQLKNVPIVAMTSHANEPKYQALCLSVGMNDVCGKPTAAELEALVFQYAIQPETLVI